MKTFFLTLLPLLLVGILSASGQGTAVVKDLQTEWKSYEEGKFIPFTEHEKRTDVTYFEINSKEHQRQFLRVSSARDLNIFVNNYLAASGRNVVLSIDSLAREFSSSNLLVAVYQNSLREENISTQIIEKKKPAFEDELVKRSGSAFTDFTITGLLLLIVFGIVVVRQNPKLAGDYFALSRIVSTREMDEGQTSIRIGSSTNILFYAYSSMLVAYYLMIIFHFIGDKYAVASSFAADNYFEIFLDWLRLSSILLLLTFIKIIVIFAFSYLFGFSEIAGFHFFNWVRLLLVVLGTLVLFLFIYVIWHGNDVGVYSIMLKLLGWFAIAWIIIIFLKLGGKVGASMFHLFSYICATELIPFLFIIKVLYN